MTGAAAQEGGSRKGMSTARKDLEPDNYSKWACGICFQPDDPIVPNVKGLGHDAVQAVVELA